MNIAEIINRDAIYMPKMQREKVYNKKAVIMIYLLNPAHNFQGQNSISIWFMIILTWLNCMH